MRSYPGSEEGVHDSRPVLKIRPMPGVLERASVNFEMGSTMSTVVAIERRRPVVMRPMLG